MWSGRPGLSAGQPRPRLKTQQSYYNHDTLYRSQYFDQGYQIRAGMFWTCLKYTPINYYLPKVNTAGRLRPWSVSPGPQPKIGEIKVWGKGFGESGEYKFEYGKERGSQGIWAGPDMPPCWKSCAHIVIIIRRIILPAIFHAESIFSNGTIDPDGVDRKTVVAGRPALQRQHPYSAHALHFCAHNLSIRSYYTKTGPHQFLGGEMPCYLLGPWEVRGRDSFIFKKTMGAGKWWGITRYCRLEVGNLHRPASPWWRGAGVSRPVN